MLVLFGVLLTAAILLFVFVSAGSAAYPIILLLSFGLAVIYVRFFRAGLYNVISKTNEWICFGVMVLFCFGVNYIAAINIEIEPSVDFATNYKTAVCLTNWKPFDYLYVALFPHIFGYASVLSLFMQRFGQSLELVKTVNVVFTTLTGVMIYLLCRRYYDKNRALLALLVWSVCPSKLLYNSMVLPEPYYTFMIFLFFVLIMVNESIGAKTDNLLILLPCALLIGAASGYVLFGVNIARPIALILIIALFIWVLVLRGDRAGDMQKWLSWICFAAALLVCYSNYSSYWHEYSSWRLQEEPASMPAYSIYVGLDPVSGGSYSDDDMNMLMNYRYDRVNGSAVWAQEQMMEEVRSLLASGEVKPLKLLVTKLPKLLGSDEGGAYYAYDALAGAGYKYWAAASNVWYYFCIALCLYAVYEVMKENRCGSILLLPLFSIGLILAHMIVEVAGRYKYCLIPVIVVLGAAVLLPEKCPDKTENADQDSEKE